VLVGTTDPLQLPLVPVQTPSHSVFQSPMARVSIRISPKVVLECRLAVYNYHEEFGLFNIYQKIITLRQVHEFCGRFNAQDDAPQPTQPRP
jgi:hypothetical protein